MLVQREQQPALLTLTNLRSPAGDPAPAGVPAGHMMRSTVEQRVAWDDLPASLFDGLENGPSGRDWLRALDARLAQRFPLLRRAA